jgi:hypothetical protein
MTDRYAARLERLYRAIVDYKTENDGCAPSLRQLIDLTDYTSVSVVRYGIETLELKGRIEVIVGKGNQMCGIKVVGARWIAPEGNGK